MAIPTEESSSTWERQSGDAGLVEGQHFRKFFIPEAGAIDHNLYFLEYPNTMREGSLE